MADAARIVAFLDLTSLTGEETEAQLDALCAKATTPLGPVAAVCVYGDKVAQVRARLPQGATRIAAVANFPEGDADPARAREESAAAVAAGADEIDVVLPWQAWLAGDPGAALAVVEAARAEAPVLKVILESGALGAPEVVAGAARAALEAGADFVKTSTGFASSGATHEDLALMRRTVSDRVQIKAAGGVRTLDDLLAVMELGVTRIGATQTKPILDEYRARIAGAPAEASAAGDGGAY